MAFVPPGNQSLPSSLTQYASRLLDCYVRFGEELWGRSWNIPSESLRRAVREVEGNAVGPRRPQHLVSNLLDEYANYVSGMAMAAGRIDGRQGRMPGEEDRAGEGTPPQTIGRMIEWPSEPGASSTSLALPVRFIESSQAGPSMSSSASARRGCWAAAPIS